MEGGKEKKKRGEGWEGDKWLTLGSVIGHTTPMNKSSARFTPRNLNPFLPYKAWSSGTGRVAISPSNPSSIVASL